MHDDPPKRALPERTGKHYCVRCLTPVSAEDYQRNDHICNACTEQDEYPLASTPDPKPAKKR
ncbi:MAG TPA: hypothetical protein VEK57_13075 [Thermoanaerobaculia bacterium]|nr:hypothetical protein [Thermoanaerobaculia bacterium]